MNYYSLLCILYQLVEKEDQEELLYLAREQEVFKELSFGTIIEGKYKVEILCKQLSKPQSIMLYSYGYLYQKLKGNLGASLFKNKWGELLQLSKEKIATIEQAFTKERIRYIQNRNQENQWTTIRGIIVPEEYLVKFIKELTLSLSEEGEQSLQATGKKKVLSHLAAKEYEHPDDYRLLEALRGNKMLEAPLKLFIEYDIERFIKVQYTGSNIKVTPHNMPYVYEAVQMACRILEVDKIPEIYIQQGFQINGCTTGVENPVIILNAGCLSLLDYEELLFIIGHEVGHIKSQHLMYHMIGQALPYLGEIAAQMTLGIGGIIGAGLQISLYNWHRKSELTADRAGLLVCQNHGAAIRALMKCAGYPPQFYDSMNEADFLKQVDQFESLDSEAYNKVVKVLCSLYQTHPWTVLRAKELNTWYKQGNYLRIIDGKI